MSVLDEKVLAELKGLMGDEYITIYEAFEQSLDQNIPALDHAVSTHDLEKIETIVHTLKGSSANVGAKAMSKICTEMLDDAKNSNTDKFTGYMKNLNREYNDIKQAIKGLTQ